MNKIISALCFSIVALSVVAQNNPSINQADTARQQRETDQVLREVGPGDSVPSLFSEEDADIGPQTVLRKKKPTWFRGTADAQIFYTDNMFFQDGNEQEAGLAVTTVEAALTTPPYITRFASYRAEVGYRHQFFNYFGSDDVLAVPGTILTRRFDAEDFDFDSSTAFAEIVAQTKHYQFRAGFDYTRLLGFEPLRADDYEEFYREYVPRWSVQRNLRVCDRSMLSLAYLGSYHFADEDPPVIFGFVPPALLRLIPDDRSERWEHTFLAAYSFALPCNVIVQPYYRFQYTDFANLETELYLNTAGLALGWYPCANFGVRGFAGYNWQYSDRSNVAEYEQLNAGGGVNVTLRF